MFSEDDTEKEIVSDDVLGEVLEEEPEDDDENDPLMAADEEEGKDWN